VKRFVLPACLAVVLGVPVIAPGAAAAHRSAPAATKSGLSFGFISAGDTFDAVGNLTHGQLKVTGHLPAGDKADAEASAISPNGHSAVFALDNGQLAQVEHLTKAVPIAGPTLDLSGYTGEGGKDYTVYTDGAALTNRVGLVAFDSQGVIQLRSRKGTWHVDKRVKFPGKNDAGTAHRAGLIRFKVTNDHRTFDGVVIGQVQRADGSYVALASARSSDDGNVAVITGVGTAHPQVVKMFTMPGFADPTDGGLYGHGGMVLSPVTPEQGLMVTPTGIDFLNLKFPANPSAVALTVGAPNSVSAVAIAPDGNHFAVASGGKVVVFRGLLHTAPKAIGQVTVFPAVPAGPTYSLNYVTSHRLLAVHEALADDGVTTDYRASVIKKAGAKHPVVLKSVELSGKPMEFDGDSVWPAAPLPTLRVAPKHLKVGEKSSIVATVRHGVGRFTFSVVNGKLPKGLRLRKSGKITGTVEHPVRRKVTLRAVNQYGGAVFKKVKLRVT